MLVFQILAKIFDFSCHPDEGRISGKKNAQPDQTPPQPYDRGKV